MEKHIPVVEFSSISKIFAKRFFGRKKVEAVCNVSLTLEEGETFCLIGPNGAGKTTLIRLLMNFVKPTFGSAYIFGQPNHIPSLRDSIGYFPERVKYPPHLTVKQFLMYWGQFGGLDGKHLFSRVNELLKFVRMDEKKDELIKHLSKGMTVRVGLAQALLNEPKLLILDEPTDGLDPLGRIEFRDMLKELKAQGKTIFINSHLLSEVEQISTRVGIMDQGQLVKVDRLENLTAPSKAIEISFTPTSPDTILKLKEKFEVRSSVNDWHLMLVNSEELDNAIKQLTSLGATIHNIDKNQATLESKFLSILGLQ